MDSEHESPPPVAATDGAQAPPEQAPATTPGPNGEQPGQGESGTAVHTTGTAAPQPRLIEKHLIGGLKNHITLEAMMPPGRGGASTVYRARFKDNEGTEREHLLVFQDGPIGEQGVNGLTNEVLLAIVLDRLEGFQGGEFPCQANEDAYQRLQGAIMDVDAAMTALHERTRERTSRGVEGQHAP